MEKTNLIKSHSLPHYIRVESSVNLYISKLSKNDGYILAKHAIIVRITGVIKDLPLYKGLKMLRSTLKNLSLGLILFFYSFQIQAGAEQEKQLPCHSNESNIDSKVKKAASVKKIAPKYPIDAARKGQEGWVRLSFVVKEDGSVELPIIEDSSGIKSFEKAAMKAVKKWTFDPATKGGKTIEQCQNSVQLNFQMNKTTKGASRKFVKGYRKILQLIDNQKLDEAAQALNKFEQKNSSVRALCYQLFENNGVLKRDSVRFAFALVPVFL